MDLKLWQLFSATRIALDRARELARGAKRDEARDWLRFISNAQIVPLLCHYKGQIPMDVDKLKADLDKLADECHPGSHADHSTEFAEIKTSLDALAFGIFKILEKQDGRP